MHDPDSGSMSAAQKRELGTEQTEFRVRQRITYTVSRYTPARGSGPVADNLTLDQANDLAKAYGRSHPGSKVTLMSFDERRHPQSVVAHSDAVDLIALEQGLFNRLMQLPRGSAITIWLDEAKRAPFVGDMRYGTSFSEEYEDPDSGHTNAWSGEALSWYDAAEYKRRLASLPYPLAAAVRRNARATCDSTMLLLLDEAQVALDA